MSDPDTLWEILNSEFVKSLSGSALGALAGAGAGAWAAQYIAERVKVRDEALKELRSNNAAITLIFSVANAYINLKSQHVQRLWQKFQETKLAAIRALSTNVPIRSDIDLENLDPPSVSMAEIKRIVIEHITAPTRAIALLDVLDRTNGQLGEFIRKRNELISDFKNNGFDEFRYLGLPRAGMLDRTYETTLSAMSSHTDECIYFSTNLAQELTRHGEALKLKLPKSIELHVVTADFTKAAHLIPSSNQFPGWEDGFRKPAKTYPSGLNFWRSTPHDA